MILGPYRAKKNGNISYVGNKIFKPIEDISSVCFNSNLYKDRVIALAKNPIWKHLSKINNTINFASTNYFNKLQALFTILPLTTRMISSPGAVYGEKVINYTTDTSPISLDWFELDKKIFLAESSQIYLELALLQKDINHVYAIYNSFRKEKADFCHLSEFHHIEYEGKVTHDQNLVIALGLVKYILKSLLSKNIEDLSYFLSNQKIEMLSEYSNNIDKTPNISFKEALNLLFEQTKDDRFLKFTQEDNFGAWEEILLTEIIGGHVIVSEFPLLEVPFYHDIKKGSNPKVAINSDFIWSGYREYLGSGQRIGGVEDLKYKAKIFNLPKNDYRPYLQSRELENYTQTSGFGLGWERFLQGLLEMPFIWSVSHFPRGHKKLIP